jgi:hypothetical protein
VTGRDDGVPDHRGAEGAQGRRLPGQQGGAGSHAEGNGADRELVDALRTMDKHSFDGPNAVMKELKGSLTGSID